MKLWLSGVALLLASSTAWAENYRFVQSPSLKLDVWIDNISSTSVQSWCAKELPLRIVANGEKNSSLLVDFMPKLGALLESQCARLQRVNWRMEDSQGHALASGTADRDKDWDLKVAPVDIDQLPAKTDPDGHPVAADRTPWQEFTLQDGCRLRTFWTGNSGASALFIPDGQCEKGGWLSGPADVTLREGSEQKQVPMTFVHGFPVNGLRSTMPTDDLLITTLNNERMVLSNEQAPQTWMILPYKPEINAWVVSGIIVVKAPREMAMDEANLQRQLASARKVWSRWLPADAPITFRLVDSLQTQMRDPAVGAWRTQN